MTQNTPAKRWTLSTTTKLVALYEKYGAPIWNTDDPEDVWVKIAEKMEESPKRIHEKIKSIEKQYEKEKQNFDTDPEYKTKWDLYKKLDEFLGEHVQRRLRRRKHPTIQSRRFQKKVRTLERLNEKNREIMTQIEELNQKAAEFHKLLANQVKEKSKDARRVQEEMEKILLKMENGNSNYVNANQVVITCEPSPLPLPLNEDEADVVIDLE